MSRVALWLAAFALALPGALLAQQQVDRAHGRFSIDASLGVGGLAGGDYLHRSSLALDATGASRLGDWRKGGLVLALSGGVQTPTSNSESCPGGGSGGCFGAHPTFYSVGALLGWEQAGRSGRSLRVVAGPAIYDAGSGEQATFAAQVRLDVATSTFRHLALVLSARGAWLPDVDGDAIGLGAVGIGIRIR